MKKIFTILILVFSLSVFAGDPPNPLEGVKNEDAYPKYIEYNGIPIWLLTSGEHYGSIINGAFDYIAYLDELQSLGFNYTRIFGLGNFFASADHGGIPSNLFPNPEDCIFPYVFDGTTDCPDGLYASTYANQCFDMTTFNPAFFARQKDFVHQAGLRGIIVEITWISAFYSVATYSGSPYWHQNNNTSAVNIASSSDWLKDTNVEMMSWLDAAIIHTMDNLKDETNVFYELANEPDGNKEFKAYYDALFPTINNTMTNTLGNDVRFLLAEQITYSKNNSTVTLVGSNINGAALRPNCNIITGHYTSNRPWIHRKMITEQVANPAYPPIISDENGFVNNGDNYVEQYIWELLANFVDGSAGYNNLDFTFNYVHPDGDQSPPVTSHGGGPILRSHFSYVKKLIDSLEWYAMTPNNVYKDQVGYRNVFDTLATVAADTVRYAGAIYSDLDSNYFCVMADPYAPFPGGDVYDFVLNIPAGRYQFNWIDPMLEEYSAINTVNYNGGDTTLTASFDNVAILWVQPLPAESTVDSDLIAQWLLNETSGTTAADNAGALDGTLVNFDFTSTQTIGGRTGLQFDGIDNYIDFGDILDPDTSDFSISFWYYQTDTLLETDYLISKENRGALGFSTRLKNGRLAASSRNASGNITVFADVLESAKWHHVVTIYDRSNELLTIYSDTIQTGQRYLPVTNLNNDFKLLFGAYPSDNPAKFFKGVMSDVRVYDKAFNKSEVVTIYTE